MTANSYADVMQLNMLQFVAATSQIEAWCLMFSEDYFFNTFPSKAPAEMAYVKFISLHKTARLDAAHILTLSHVMQSMDDTFADTANVYRDELLQIKMKILFLEVDNIFHYRIADDAKDDTDTSRQQYLFRQFLQLLSANAKREHTVDFYADKLCITTQYLGRIVRNFGHGKIYNLIARAVVGEIEIMLADSSIPLKQIATDMNFSDQSVFTKFFKRQTGMSPLQYRNSL
jgi:AraC family transcriptional activator of pobA